MRKYFYFSLLLLTSCTYNLIGKKVPPYPNGTFSQYGACITSHLGYERMCEYSIGILENEQREHIGLLVLRSLKQKRNDPNDWIVTDHIKHPKVGYGNLLMYGSCMMNQDPDETILAIVEGSHKEYLKATNWAMQVNLNSGKFEKISPSLVSCYNEGYQY
ncbi:MAG: hypothetical protein HWE16_09310 [Gammaproteobacteria bacterium]|nr:hypothetical protein [Gammaproteobacteria bacterium]